MIALDVLSICIFQYGKLEISSGHRLGRKSYPLSCREMPFNHGQNVLSERKTTRKKALQQVGCATEEAFMVGKQLQTAQLPCVPQDPTAWTFFIISLSAGWTLHSAVGGDREWFLCLTFKYAEWAPTTHIMTLLHTEES